MKSSTLEKLRYPIGHFVVPDAISDTHRLDWIAKMEALPVMLEDLVKDLTPEQLETPYRPGGWTVRQVVHHIADSHHNSYVRFKWALTEEAPLIKPYDEKAWAELFDTRSAPLHLSLNHLKAIHAKLVYLLRGLSEEELSRTYVHPEGKEEVSVEENIGRYAWHGLHHYTQIRNLMMREGWIISSDKSILL
jgi:uncharacterized damage-inducible protein DinB